MHDSAVIVLTCVKGPSNTASFIHTPCFGRRSLIEIYQNVHFMVPPGIFYSSSNVVLSSREVRLFTIGNGFSNCSMEKCPSQ